MKSHVKLLAIAVLTITCSSIAFASGPAPKPVIQVDTVNTATDVNVSAEYLEALNQSIALQLGKTKRFDSIAATGDGHNSAVVALEVRGTVTQFKAGSRAARIAATSIGRMMGVGETKLVTHVILLETGSGNVIWEGDVAGAQKGNGMINPTSAFSGSSTVANIEAANIAKAIAKAIDHQPKLQP